MGRSITRKAIERALVGYFDNYPGGFKVEDIGTDWVLLNDSMDVYISLTEIASAVADELHPTPQDKD